MKHIVGAWCWCQASLWEELGMVTGTEMTSRDQAGKETKWTCCLCFWRQLPGRGWCLGLAGRAFEQVWMEE